MHRATPRTPPGVPRLVLSPAAWLKLTYLAHRAGGEVGGFGLSAGDDPLHVIEFATVRQRSGWASVGFDDDAVADHFDACADAGLPPDRCGRVWVHTHPGDSAEPSSTDEATFARAFGRCGWAVMMIVSRTGRTYARLSFSAGPGGSIPLPVSVDWPAWPELIDGDGPGDGGVTWERRVAAWREEFGANIRPAAEVPPGGLADLWDAEGWAAGLGPSAATEAETATETEEVLP
jgi:hypothetical protein